MRADLAHLPIDDEVGATRRHDNIIEQPRHHRESRDSENKQR